ncbi:Pyrimidine 5'-nucleotidase YjjG [compost metagenome]
MALTNWFYEIQTNKLKKTNIYDYFEEVYCIDNSYLKPNKNAYKKLLDKYNAQNCYMVGDSFEYDIMGAKNLGISTIWYNKKNKQVYNNISDYTVSTLYDIKNIL